MENKIEVYEFNSDISVKDNVKNFIIAKQKALETLRQFKRLEDVYAEEIAEQSLSMHKTATGAIIFIEDLEDEHLLNIVKLLMRNGISFRNEKAKVYMQEIKKRGLVSGILSYNVIESEDEENIEDFMDEEDFIN